MAESDIRIEKIKARDLLEFTRQELSHAHPGQFIPITQQRAQAHVNNPLVTPDDVSLLVAYHDDQVVGFFGMMPIWLLRNNHLDKVTWFSTWRVSPHLRGKSLGSLLMQAALDLKQDFVIVGSGPARRVCQRFGFLEREPYIYYQLDLTAMVRLNPATWLTRLARKLLRPFHVRIAVDNRLTLLTDRLLSPITRRLFTWLSWRMAGSVLDQYHIREVEQVQPETPEQLANQPAVCFSRGYEVVNWMLRFPWVLEPGGSPSEHMDYYFSDVRPYFHYSAVEIYAAQNTGETYQGYVIFLVSTIRDRMELKILDVSLKGREVWQVVLPLAIRMARKFKVDRIDLPVKASGDFQQTGLGRLLLQKRQRIYQSHPKSPESPLALAWKDIAFQYSDGDMSFS